VTQLPEDLRVTTAINPDDIPFARLERDWGTTYMNLPRRGECIQLLVDPRPQASSGAR
jgi:hypothetical protein